MIRFDVEAEFKHLLQAMAEIDTIPDSELELWDLDDPGITLSVSEIRSLAEFAQQKKHRPRKTAVLVNDDLSFGLIRMYMVYREQPNTETRVFRNRGEALDWLLMPVTNPDPRYPCRWGRHLES